MDIKKLLDILAVAEQLKHTMRHSWTSQQRHESVAEHSWRLALFAYFIKDEFPTIHLPKLLLMCLFHDLGESFTGDIPAFLKTEQDEIEEHQTIYHWLNQLPQPYQKELTDLFDEMHRQQSLEAKVYKALDKLEALIQHNEASLETWTEDDYRLSLTYGNKEVECSPYLQLLRQQIKEDTLLKIKQQEDS